MSLFDLKSKIVVSCPKGVPPVLRQELNSLGFHVLSETVSSIETEGSLQDCMRLNLCIRTGNRVLFLIEQFPAQDPEDLYRQLSQMRWEDYIRHDGFLTVTSSVDNPSIRDSRYANLKCKDAIVDRIKEKCGLRPDSGSGRTGAVVYLHWKGENCSIYFDTSGEPLAKRGYRKIPFQAPVQETIAAALVLTSGWNGNSNFINPMCGSGTIAIEAALIALGRMPGLLRSNFGFRHLLGFDEEHWQTLRKTAKAAAKKSLQGRIVATDIDPGAIQAAKRNAMTAGVEHLIDFHVCDYQATPIPSGAGIIMINPEYGARLGKVKDLEKIYRGIGDFFKSRCSGHMAYVFTGNLELAKKVGLRTKRRIPFFNSRIECRLLEYELYKGSRKAGKSETENQDGMR